MRISGNIFERLVVKILPLCFSFGLLFYLTTNKTVDQFAKPFIWTIMVLWTFDSLTILSKKIKRMTIVNNHVILGQDRILSDDILSIVPRKDKRRGIDIKTIEIEYLKDGLTQKQRTITKPIFLDIFGKKFKTIDLLVDRFPNLRNRVMEETED